MSDDLRAELTIRLAQEIAAGDLERVEQITAQLAALEPGELEAVDELAADGPGSNDAERLPSWPPSNL